MALAYAIKINGYDAGIVGSLEDALRHVAAQVLRSPHHSGHFNLEQAIEDLEGDFSFLADAGIKPSLGEMLWAHLLNSGAYESVVIEEHDLDTRPERSSKITEFDMTSALPFAKILNYLAYSEEEVMDAFDRMVFDLGSEMVPLHHFNDASGQKTLDWLRLVERLMSGGHDSVFSMVPDKLDVDPLAFLETLPERAAQRFAELMERVKPSGLTPAV